MQGEYCWSTTPVLRQKNFENTGLEKNYRIYLIIVVYSRIQPNSKIQPNLKAQPIKVSGKETQGTFLLPP
jgi:hypothetical protein